MLISIKESLLINNISPIGGIKETCTNYNYRW